MSKPTNTADQLRALMRSHIQNSNFAPHTAPVITPAPKAPVIATTVAAPASQDIISPSNRTFSPRYSLRLLPAEISKINIIINSSMNATGERLTLTDVLRIGLGRLGEGTPIGKEEIDQLRVTDGRRTHR